MNILVIGSGGREHALCWKIAQSPLCSKLYCAPGNDGIAQIAELLPIPASDGAALCQAALELKIDLTVIGPDDCLADGLTDRFQAAGLTVFGPTKAAAELEWSKGYAKNFMQRHQIPTARWAAFDQEEAALAYLEKSELPIVIKADGLALGKGVIIAQNYSEAVSAVHRMMAEDAFGSSGQTIVIEEYLPGREISVLSFCDGDSVRCMLPAEDHKQVFDQDLGPNTGGMGVIVPVGFVSPELMSQIERQIMQPVLSGMAEEGKPFSGILFAGIMLTEQGPKVLEYNARFGDPETQSLMLLLQSDLVPILLACCHRTLAQTEIKWNPGVAACIVLASGGYPINYQKGFVITGLDQLPTDLIVFHAATKMVDGQWLTNGGRVLGLAARGADLNDALKKVYAACDLVLFEKKHYRMDIGRRNQKL
ncbi:MAG TPA: phosphoribosylamine--glycine ligase [Bacillota bacterium]|nr:phosphoribosylamine--glycine ligase [Bacillota bacterium]